MENSLGIRPGYEFSPSGMENSLGIRPGYEFSPARMDNSPQILTGYESSPGLRMENSPGIRPGYEFSPAQRISRSSGSRPGSMLLPKDRKLLRKSNIPAKQMKLPENGNIPANICQLYAESKQMKLPESNIPAKQMKLPENGNIAANFSQLYAAAKQIKLPENGSIPANLCQLYAEATQMKLPENGNIPANLCQRYVETCRGGGKRNPSQVDKSGKKAESLPLQKCHSAPTSEGKSRTKRASKGMGFASRKRKSQLSKTQDCRPSVKTSVQIEQQDHRTEQFEDVESLSQSMDSFQFEDLIETNPHLKQNKDIPYEPLKHFNGHFSEDNIFDLMPYVLLSEILPEEFMAAHYNGGFQGDVSCSLIFPRMFLEDIQIDQREWLTVVGLVFGMVEFLPYFDRNFGFLAARESQDLPAFKSSNIIGRRLRKTQVRLTPLQRNPGLPQAISQLRTNL
ncbi:unnamed protein product [Bursaphelenchus xylophilus]|uniref:(pine wood nematode) hypothetical protein n=1 Tax=Bursaphelenchus xylophilus TaxID=6326 RepID=A0A811JZA3_BURXY|nr:unnamed protein product [Bursaphelenchus xylophilus]CAG9080995.1 unnamed protein product [Bursaphelenchus xylophilus]